MIPPLVTGALSLASLVPTLWKWLLPEEVQEIKNTPHNIAEKVLDIAQKITGIQDPISAADVLKKDSALLLKFQENIALLERDLIQASLADQEGARRRDIAMLELGRSNLRADIMVVAAALGLIACLVSLVVFQSKLPGEAVGIISTVAGIFGSCLKDAYAFEFGSSRGSKNKDLTKLAHNLKIFGRS